MVTMIDAKLIDALSSSVKAAGKRRLLDHLYGPDALANRHWIIYILDGGSTAKVTPNDKRCQWGHFRKILLKLAGVTDAACIADGDAKFQAVVDRVFNLDRSIMLANGTRVGP